MSAYCELSDVQAKRPQHPMTATSKPTADQATTLIEDVSAMVDGRLAAVGFVVPITGPKSLAYLRSAVSWGVAGQIENGQRAGIAGDSAGGSAVRSSYWDTFETMIKAVEESQGILSDAPLASDEANKGSKGAVLESFFTKYPDDVVTSGQRGRLTGAAVPRFEMRTEF